MQRILGMTVEPTAVDRRWPFGSSFFGALRPDVQGVRHAVGTNGIFVDRRYGVFFNERQQFEFSCN